MSNDVRNGVKISISGDKKVAEWMFNFVAHALKSAGHIFTGGASIDAWQLWSNLELVLDPQNLPAVQTLITTPAAINDMRAEVARLEREMEKLKMDVLRSEHIREYLEEKLRNNYDN